jgi:hypothetical protein
LIGCAAIPVTWYRRSASTPFAAGDGGEGRPGAGIPVTGRVDDQLAVAVEQPVVHGPPVDRHRVDPDLPEPVADAGQQRAGVPAQHAADRPRPVREPVHHAEAETTFRSVSNDHPPAGGAEIDGRDPDRPHRRNPAATPESTGTCSPVV